MLEDSSQPEVLNTSCPDDKQHNDLHMEPLDEDEHEPQQKYTENTGVVDINMIKQPQSYKGIG